MRDKVSVPGICAGIIRRNSLFRKKKRVMIMMLRPMRDPLVWLRI